MLFGADGDRDTTKRAEMGAIAARGADVVVITDFHPRCEDPAAIRAALIEGARAAVPDREIHEIADPRAAFRAALALAGEGDAILYAGPGHEDYHEVKGVKIPYSATRRREAGTARGGLGRMIALTLAEIASAVGGTLHLDGTDAAADTVVAGAVTTDSREIAPGDVFFAKPGEFDRRPPVRPDGRASRVRPCSSSSTCSTLAVPQIVVADAVAALGATSRPRSWRGCAPRGDLASSAITGSNGKTTTKNLLRARPRARRARPSRRGPRSTTRSARPLTMLARRPTTRGSSSARWARARRRDRPARADGSSPTSASC